MPEPTFRCDLVLLGEATPPEWPLGRRRTVPPTPHAVAELSEWVHRHDAAPFLLTWDLSIGALPKPTTLQQLANGPGDVWHAGLLIGQAGQPWLLDFVHPTWMLNADPHVHRPASSWRLSLRCCLARSAVWRELGGPRPDFTSLRVASLELGHRWLWGGALVRHTPVLVSRTEPESEPELEFSEVFRFLLHRVGRRWAAWALLRAVVSRAVGVGTALRSWRSTRNVRPRPSPNLEQGERWMAPVPDELSVTVLIPTVDRYPWLDVLLDQLRHQTVGPLEILVIDQTPVDVRRTDWSTFADLPLRVVEQDRPGQCSSRNQGLRLAQGDAVLFLDDDDEVPPNLIEQHLVALRASGADASCGVADEADSGPLPVGFTNRRVSDVFPTNNSLLRRKALAATGLFDLAYETGARADADLGQRLYQAGALLVLEPTIRVLHHHAPSGGLRRHKARTVTYGTSRRSIRTRHLPSPTELYLARRYFTPRQVREADILRIAGTFALRGSLLRRMAKWLWATGALPDTLWKVRQSRRRAAELLGRFPQIPNLEDDPR